MSETKPQIYVSVGRRKTSTARVRLTAGTGKFTVNGKDADTYLYDEVLRKTAFAGLTVAGVAGQFDGVILVEGGGPNSQSGAIALGIARSLQKFNPEFRSALKKAGLLRRDPRMREREKAGQPGPRKRFQFSKR